MVWK
jgi:NIMA (never in mitosis gene a)-related kinase 2